MTKCRPPPTLDKNTVHISRKRKKREREKEREREREREREKTGDVGTEDVGVGSFSPVDEGAGEECGVVAGAPRGLEEPVAGYRGWVPDAGEQGVVATADCAAGPRYQGSHF